MKPLVIYHADCTDGFGAAFAAWLKLGDEAEYLPMQYGKDTTNWFNLVSDREIYILDFSFPRNIMDAVFAYAKRVVWLDHHRTAFEMWCGPGYIEHDELFYDFTAPHHITLDNNKSGAYLAWEFFHPDTEVPMLIRHIDDRDRWQFKLEESKAVHAALSSYKPWSFEQWRENFWSPYTGAVGYFEEELNCLYSEGAAILRAQDANVASMAKQARKCSIPHAGDECEEAPWEWDTGGYWHAPGLATNASLHQSELGHVLATQSGTYGLIWYVAADGKVKCSLRSNGDYDVSAIAKVFGGGGHRNASGFETDIDTLRGWLK